MKKLVIIQFERFWIFINYYGLNRKRLLTLSHDEAFKLYKEFTQAAIKARRIEMENVGGDHQKVIDFWEKTTRKGFELLNAIDINKKHRLKTIIFKKEVVVSFIIGFISGLLANIIYSLLFSSP